MACMCLEFHDLENKKHKLLCPECIDKTTPKPEPKKVHDCIVNKVYKSVLFDAANSEHKFTLPTAIEEVKMKSMIRHTLNMALEICK